MFTAFVAGYTSYPAFPFSVYEWLSAKSREKYGKIVESTASSGINMVRKGYSKQEYDLYERADRDDIKTLSPAGSESDREAGRSERDCRSTFRFRKKYGPTQKTILPQPGYKTIRLFYNSSSLVGRCG
jgi:hypothetical protein